MTGNLIAGRYEILEQIGRGGMARVYRAMDLNLGREVAVKVLLESFAKDPEFIERFRREAKASAALDHPNIVRIYDFAETQNLSFLVMELVRGEDVRAKLARVGRFSINEAVRIIMSVLDAVQAAHNAGFIHRDLSAKNVLIANDGTVKVSDFGIARVLGEHTLAKTGCLVGSVQYISPEQAAGDETDARSDIYSIGVLFYEMLAGRLPFIADNPVQLALKHIRETPLPPSEFCPQLPRAVEDVILKAMEKEPDDRFPDAAFMADSLRLAFPEANSSQFNDAVDYGDAAIISGAAGAYAADDFGGYQPDGEEAEAGIGRIFDGSDEDYALDAADISDDDDYFENAQTLVRAPLPEINPGEYDEDYDSDNDGDYDEYGEDYDEDDYDDYGDDDYDEYDDEDSAISQPQAKPAKEARKKTPRERRESFAKKFLTFTILVLVAMVVGAGSMVWKTLNSGPSIEVPDVVGQPVSAATQALADMNLVLKVQEQVMSKDQPPGIIVNQIPKAGGKLSANGTVYVTVTRGEEQITVPDISGLKEEDARRLLEKLGLTAWISYEDHSEVAKGVVFRQEPGAGAHVFRGDSVSVIVSSGAGGITMPGVVGQKEKQAREILEDLGFTVVLASEITSDKEEPGTVAEQEPPAGAKVKKGQKVTLKLYAEKREITVPDVVGLSPEAAASELKAARLDIQVEGEAGSDGVVTKQVPPAGTVFSGHTVIVYTSLVSHVPNICGMQLAEAREVIAQSGYTLGSVDLRPGDGMPGEVVEQDPPGGLEYPAGTVINIVIVTDQQENASAEPPPEPTAAPGASEQAGAPAPE